MILGDKFFLTSDIRESFSRSGLSHIIAISGLHITLLASLFLSFLLFLGISRRQAFYFNILFLVFLDDFIDVNLFSVDEQFF